MPTIAESGHQMNGDLIDRLASTESWTDALPNCHQTGVGTQSNQLYKRNGGRQEFHSCEDKSFHFHSNSNDNTYFYGLFDGHEGSNAANFVAQHLPAEFLLGQLPNQELTDDESTALFQSAFVSLEREYFQSIADSLAERTQLEYQLQGMSPLEAYQEFPEIVDRLKVKTGEVSSGTAAVVALIHYNRLHVANVGDSKAILCRTDPSDPKNFKVSQLSTDHDLNNNPNELSRLLSLGLEIDKLRQRQRIGSLSITRCIGNYLVKGAYKDFPDLCAAKDEPIIAEPSIKSVTLDDSCQFLLLASGSIFRALEDATGSHQVNSDLVRMVAEEFKIQSTLTGVAQAVVNKICRIHQDEYLRSMDDFNLPQSRKQIEDLTLMVRNFNHPLIRGISSRSASVSSMHRQFSDQLRISIDEEDNALPDGDFRGRSASHTLMTTTPHSAVSTVTDEHRLATDSSSNTTTTTTTTTNSDFEDKRFSSQKADPLDVDSEGKIEAYVKFDEFFDAIKKAKTNGQSFEWTLN